MDGLLHFFIVSVILALEKGGHSDWRYEKILFRRLKLMGHFWAALNIWYKACQGSSNSIHSYMLNLITSIASNFLFLTQFIKSHGFLFFDVISCILSLKKALLVLLIELLNFNQSDLDLNVWYMAKFMLYSSFYHAFDCLVMLTHFECLIQRHAVIVAKS